MPENQVGLHGIAETEAAVQYEDTDHGKWTAKHPHRSSDSPRVTVWMPEAAPWARLQTRSHGCNEPDTLDDGPAIAYLDIAGVQIGGYLEDLEMLLAAAQDTLRWLREQEQEIRARMAASEPEAAASM